ncbi:hypothetical protein BRARA_B02796 [Brassica rapa]|uniref:DUF4283 domain-containing protein n=1 Tax=Brassica campestris TaxID=3711 RepID=A0A398AFU4_BRACM|nr:hypothetical protein BRARA_B02796 [Brassica rapa]
MLSHLHQAPCTGRVRVEERDNLHLIQKHSLTVVGRVTNPSLQKVWSLIPFFTEKWSTCTRPRGSDVGQGMFQFQFDSEANLLEILEKRPYTYAKWMVIIQRWEQMTAPDFPSLIPFWIKREGTVESINKNIGIFEKAEISSLDVRMRVQVNGRLPLITSSVIEYPNGDEVTATLVYENIGKHCSCCFRLGHELRDSFKAKAEKRKALSIASETPREHSLSTSSPGRNQLPHQQRELSIHPTPQRNEDHRNRYYQNQEREQNSRTSESCRHDQRRSRDPMVPMAGQEQPHFNNKETTPEEVITKAIVAAQEWLREQITGPIQ